MSTSFEIKIAEQRLSVLELAKALGNVSLACKQRGVSRTQFYECKRRFQTHDLEGLVYLHSVVDAYCSFAFDFLYTSKQPEAAATVLHNDVLPFYKARILAVKAALPDNGREFCGKEDHPYELCLAPNDSEHRHTQVCRP